MRLSILYEDKEWIGVDLDGTLAVSGKFKGKEHIGRPIEKMVNRLKGWLRKGKKVKILTARAVDKEAIPYIEKWCKEHIGQVLPVTNEKDPGMTALWDDKAITVERNTGEEL